MKRQSPKAFLQQSVTAQLSVPRRRREQSRRLERSGTVIEFSIAPAYYQTSWFRLLGAAAALVLIWQRIAIACTRFPRNSTCESKSESANASALLATCHDTLLQGFHGLMLRL